MKIELSHGKHGTTIDFRAETLADAALLGSIALNANPNSKKNVLSVAFFEGGMSGYLHIHNDHDSTGVPRERRSLCRPK